MKKAETQNNLSSRYLTPVRGAEYLSISLRTMRSLLAKREIPYVQIGGKGCLVRLDVQDLDEFMAKNKVIAL